MRDNLRRYRAIRAAFTPCSPGPPSGPVARHWLTLAARLSGLVGSPSTPLPHSAATVPNGTTPASRVKRFARWCDHPHILEEGYFLPSADVLLRHLALPPLGLVMDGRGGGRGGTALRLHVGSKGRALPRAWRVRHGPQGPCPAARHRALVARSSGRIPAGTPVVLLGAGEGDGTRLPQTLPQAGWSSACRPATRTVATWPGATCRREALGACRQPGRVIECKEVSCPREAYGPIMVLGWWATG
jgi:hypothetical protein